VKTSFFLSIIFFFPKAFSFNFPPSKHLYIVEKKRKGVNLSSQDDENF